MDFETWAALQPEWPTLTDEQRAATRRAWEFGAFVEMVAAAW